MSMQEGGFESYGSHLPALLRVVSATHGPIIEFGCGYWSTPILHEVCQVLGRELVSLDTDPRFVEEFEHLRTNGSEAPHTIRLLKRWTLPESLTARRWAVVLIDCAPADARLPLLERIRPRADFIVCHDTQPEVERKYWDTALTTFAYRRDFQPLIASHPWTSVVSDVARIP